MTFGAYLLTLDHSTTHKTRSGSRRTISRILIPIIQTQWKTLITKSHKKNSSTPPPPLFYHNPKPNILRPHHALHHGSLHPRRLPPQRPTRPHRSSRRSHEEQIRPPHSLDPPPPTLSDTHEPTSRTTRHPPRARTSTEQSLADARECSNGHQNPHGLQIRIRMHGALVP